MSGVVRIGPVEAQKLNAIIGKSSAKPHALDTKKCNNRLNWTDGGHWIGIGPAPNCFHSSTSTGSMTLRYTFPSDASAFKWNKEWERQIRYVGHAATAVITAIVALKTGAGGILVGTLAGILKDELQARVPYPQVAKGWSFVLHISHTLTSSPHPRAKSSFFQEVSGTSFDPQRARHYHAVRRRELDLATFPESLARELASMPGQTRHIVYS